MTTSDDTTPIPPAVAEWLSQRAAAAADFRHRAAVVLAGPWDWATACAEAALTHLAGENMLWVGDDVPAGVSAMTGPQARDLLGQETDHVVFDAHAGFNPDAFGAIAGTLRAGGLLLLLTPALDDWPLYLDPEYARIPVEPWTPEQVSGRFLGRLVRRIKQQDSVTVIEAGTGLPPSPPTPEPPASAADATEVEPPCRTRDQARAVAALKRVAEGRPRRPVALIADRGRGKSAALGIAAANLLQRHPRRIVVTAPGRGAVEALFRHAGEQLPGARRKGGQIYCGEAAIAFIPADELAREQPGADLVLVDEAAALPGPVLETLLRYYSRIAFATTLHGYEGSGRGFALRFEQVLDRFTPSWRRITLNTPVRWAPHDPLEAFVFDALLLDAEAPPTQAEASTGEGVTVERVDRDDLAGDEARLRAVFGLLVMAHYRTTPGDLRNLLDGPNCRVWLARRGDAIVAACLTADEGPLAAATADGVARGAQRVRGHLLPQTLLFHAGERAVADLTGRRIVRIAVHPRHQGTGIGTAVLEHVRQRSQREGMAYWGAVFGATPGLIRLWHRAGLVPARLGITRESASGEHAVVMIGALNEADGGLVERVRARFAAEWPWRLPEFFTDLEPELVAEITQAAGEPGPRPAVDPDQRRHLAAYIRGEQPYENAAVAVAQAALAGLAAGGGDQLTAAQRTAVTAKALQKRDWATVAILAGLKGRRPVRDAIHAAIARMSSGMGAPSGDRGDERGP